MNNCSNYNYGPAGRAIGYDLLNNPDAVATDPVISFKTALWFWMTPQSPKPSCHDVITGRWSPSAADRAAGRLPGYGVITNIINGGIECGKGFNDKVADRIGFYKRYCDLLGVGYGSNLDCYNQRSFGVSTNSLSASSKWVTILSICSSALVTPLYWLSTNKDIISMCCMYVISRTHAYTSYSLFGGKKKNFH